MQSAKCIKTIINGLYARNNYGGMNDASLKTKRIAGGSMIMKNWRIIILLSICAIFIGSAGEARIIFQDDFDSYSDSPGTMVGGQALISLFKHRAGSTILIVQW